MSASPPIVVPVQADRYVIVDASRLHVSEEEWVMTQLTKGDRVRVTPKGGEPYDAVFDFTWLSYDLAADVTVPDPDVRITRTVYPSCGDRIDPLDRPIVRSVAA